MKALAVLIVLLLAGSSAVGAAALLVRGGGVSVHTPPWVSPIRAMDRALDNGDMRVALRHREDARLAALASPDWEGMVAVGDATLRLARSAGLEPAMEPAAWRAYRSALLRVRRQGSFAGAVRVSEAFRALGDREMASQAIGVARALAGLASDSDALERVRALEELLATEKPPVGDPLADRDTSNGDSHGTE